MSESEQPNRQIGVACSAIGASGFLLGIFMNFNRTIILLSDLIFFVGIVFILGVDRTKHLFVSPKRIPATAFMACGLLTTLFNHGFYGTLFHLIGAFLLFGGFLPYLINVLRKMPVIGPVFRIALPSFFYGMNEDTLPR